MQLIEALGYRRLLSAIAVYEWSGGPTGTNYEWAESGVNYTNPSFGPHASGATTTFTLANIPEHTELDVRVGLRSNTPAPVEPNFNGGDEPLVDTLAYQGEVTDFTDWAEVFGPNGGPQQPPQGYWKFELWAGNNYVYWDNTGIHGSTHFVHYPDSLTATVKGTWIGTNASVTRWELFYAITERYTPNVSLFMRDNAVEGKDDYPEGEEPGFIVSRIGDLELGSLVVNLEDTGEGSAIAVSDYALLPGSATIPAGQQSVFVPLEPNDESIIEWTEDVEYEVLDGPGYVVGYPSVRVAEIRDDDLVNIVVEGLPDELEDEEYNEESPGLFLPVNNDDDNNDGVPDNEQDDLTPATDDDLVRATLRFQVDEKLGPPPARVLLSLSDINKYRVWSAPGELLLGGPGGVAQIELDRTEGHGKHVYVEAISLTPYGSLTLAAQDTNATRPSDSSDMLKLASAVADLDVVDAAGIAVHEWDEEDPGAWITQVAPAALRAFPVGLDGFVRTIEWDNAEKIVVRDAGGNIVNSGLQLTEPDGLVEYTVTAAPTYGANSPIRVAVTMTAAADQLTLQDRVNLHTRQVTVKWVSTGLSALSNNPNVNGGKRLFPDMQSPTDAIWRDRVDVEATVRPLPPAGTSVYFRSFDVDDPNADPDFVLDPDDDQGNGVTLPEGGDNHGGNNRGTFVGAGVNYGTSATTDASGKARVTFQTTLQPGDNFRVAAALTNLELDLLTTWAPGEPQYGPYVPANDNQLDGVTAGLTDMLTVWRRLWIERDAMAPATPNVHTRTVTGVRTATLPGGVRTYHWLALDDGLPTDYEFEGGVVTLGALGKAVYIETNEDDTNPAVPEELVILPALLAPAEIAVLNAGGTAASIVDDDDLAVLGAPGAPTLASGGGLLTSAFGELYILPVYADAYNTTIIVPFDRHVGAGDFVTETSLDNARDLANSHRFWTTLVVSGFEPEGGGDFDPDSVPPGWQLPEPERPTYGITSNSIWSDNLSVIFLETLRDSGSSTIDHTVVHEIGHAGRNDDFNEHQPSGIMMEGGYRIGVDSFDLATQALIRGKVLW